MSEDLKRDLDLIREALDIGVAWVDTNVVGCIEAESKIQEARLVVLPRLERSIETLSSASAASPPGEETAG